MTDYLEDNVANRFEGDNSGLKTKASRDASETVSIKEGEELFTQALRGPLSQAEEIAEADIVFGIPFYKEADTIGSVLKIATKGLKEFYPDEKCVIVAAGSPAGGAALEVINNLPHVDGIKRIAFLFNDERINGKGWSLRAIAEIARSLGANLAILEADLISRSINGDTEGLAPDWIRLLLEPIKRQKMDLVISRFNRHYFESLISSHVFYPILTAIYRRRINDMAGGQGGGSHRPPRTHFKDTPKTRQDGMSE